MQRVLAFLVALLAIHPRVAAQLVVFESHAEPANNDLTAPESAVCGIQHYGNLALGSDNDLWCVTLPADGRILAWTTSRGAFGAQFASGTSATDTILTLLAADGATVLATNDDELNAPGLFSKLLIDVTAGTYYVDVSGYGADFGDYSLDVLCLPTGTSGGTAPGLQLVDSDSSNCVGSNGVPLTVAPRIGERPRVGSVWATDFAGIPTGAAVLLLGAQAPFELPSAEFDLGVIGAPGCVFSTTPFVVVPLVVSIPGQAEISLPIGDDPTSLGIRLEMQVAAIDIGANPLDAITSDRLTVTVGDGL